MSLQDELKALDSQLDDSGKAILKQVTTALEQKAQADAELNNSLDKAPTWAVFAIAFVLGVFVGTAI